MEENTKLSLTAERIRQDVARGIYKRFSVYAGFALLYAMIGWSLSVSLEIITAETVPWKTSVFYFLAVVLAVFLIYSGWLAVLLIRLKRKKKVVLWKERLVRKKTISRNYSLNIPELGDNPYLSWPKLVFESGRKFFWIPWRNYCWAGADRKTRQQIAVNAEPKDTFLVAGVNQRTIFAAYNLKNFTLPEEWTDIPG